MKKTNSILIFVAVLGIGTVFLIMFALQNQNKQPDLATQEELSKLEKAKTSSVIELTNGDTLELKTSYVKKVINGVEVKMLAYNGEIPGPLLKVEKDSEITINLKNDTDMETTLHSHGIRIDNKFDGVPNITQTPILPGETYTYKIKFNDEGMYWYHPHVREDFQQELGLYGNYLVYSKDENYWNPVNKEVPLFLDDIKMENGQIAKFDSNTVDHALMGRFGNVMLVNGDTNYSLEAKQGEVVRFYLTNSANTRTFHFSIPGIKLKLVGGDNGKFEKEEMVDAVIISPSERYIVEALFSNAGDFEIQNKTPEKAYTLGKITVANEDIAKSYLSEFNNLRVNTATQDEMSVYTSNTESLVQKNLKISIDPMGMGAMMGNSNGSMMGGDHMMGGGMMMGNTDKEKIEWEDDMGMMNKIATSDSVKWQLIDQDTSKENMDIEWSFKVGDLVRLKIFNDPESPHPMQHPIHLHGQRFVVLSTNGIENINKVWKDTSLIQTGDTVELLVDMSNPGDWLLHCHIPEHMESGMMFKYKVI